MKFKADAKHAFNLEEQARNMHSIPEEQRVLVQARNGTLSQNDALNLMQGGAQGVQKIANELIKQGLKDSK